MSKLIIVHSHELNQHGEPKQEYLARLERAGEILSAESQKVNLILTGGKATKGVDKRHADAGGDFLKNQGVPETLIHREKDSHGSLETVGEAIFALKDWPELYGLSSDITVISSDYHDTRMYAIQSLVLGNRFMPKYRFEGISRKLHKNTMRTPEQEEASLNAFRTTFAGVPIGDLDRILDTLWKKHPLYQNHPSNPYRDTVTHA